MPRVLDHVAWEACLVEPHPDKGLEAYARRKTGMPPRSLASALVVENRG